MSTQINVTVGGGGLVDQARRNQEEARWKLTERERWERSQRVEATVSGDAVPGGGRAGFRFRPDEPAANRRVSSDGWVLGPSDDTLAAKVRGFQPFVFASTNGVPFLYSTSEGPEGAPCLKVAQPPGKFVSEISAVPALEYLKVPRRGATAEGFVYVPPRTGNQVRRPASEMLMTAGPFGQLSVQVGWHTLEDEHVLFNFSGLGGGWLVADVAFGTIDEVSPASLSTGWHHWASVLELVGGTWYGHYYWDGTRRRTNAGIDPAELYPSVAWDLIYGQYGEVGDLPGSWGSFGAEPCRVHGLRYTERVLYTGDTFTPPTTITALA